VILRLDILVELRLVTDGQKEGHRAIAYPAGIASHSSLQNGFLLIDTIDDNMIVDAF